MHCGCASPPVPVLEYVCGRKEGERGRWSGLMQCEGEVGRMRALMVSAVFPEVIDAPSVSQGGGSEKVCMLLL